MKITYLGTAASEGLPAPFQKGVKLSCKSWN